MFGRKRTIRITDVSCWSGGSTHRVGALINGSELWFESPKAELRPSAEAFAGTMLLPALYTGADIEVEAPLSPVWVSNARRYLEIFGGWLKLPTVDIRSPLREPGIMARGEKTAICFSGGVDSFFTLLRGPFENAALVMIQGFDIDIEEKDLWKAVDKTLLEVAGAVEAEPMVVKANIRKHPVFLKAPYEYSHGSALAAVGHVLDGVGRFVISSSFHLSQDFPWGSHWDTDPLMSSEALEVVHWGASVKRPDKIRAIVDEPLVKRHLRVCWSSKADRYNCSKCEKCIRTMLAIEALGRLGEYEVFRPERPLAETLEKMTHISTRATLYFENIVSANPGYELSGQIRDLIERSKRHYKNKKGLSKVLGRLDYKLIRPLRRRLACAGEGRSKT
jgi:hypothetical protein